MAKEGGTGMSGSDNTQKKRNNYKLLVDPELRRGHKKLYRLNGKDVPGVRRSLIRMHNDSGSVADRVSGVMDFTVSSLSRSDAASRRAGGPAYPEDGTGHGRQLHGAGHTSLQGRFSRH